MILIRCDCYKLSENYLKLPFGLKVRWKGKNRWEGKKQGRLEIRYDDLSRRWYAYMPVEVEKPLHQPTEHKKKRVYVDLGIINIITSWIEGEKRPEIYSGRSALSDWWYWNGKIGEHQSSMEKNGKRKTSRRLRRLFKKRQKRFRHVINTIVARFVKNCWEKGVSEIVIGDVTHIRENSRKKKKRRKANAMINNFWSFKYIYERLRITAENYGIKMRKKDEKYTSKTCSLCGKVHRNGRKHRGLYVCKTHKVTLNADVNGVANIANPIFPKPYWDRDNWLVAQPSVVRVKTTTVEPPTL